ncbi:sensor histidine kinase [Thiohalorhabdus denitrificans]|uniref:histidine kinase n=1 Tax=Thiohalorhabdus denitrificans TaxID=381306 RepID=A0A1G5FFZ5_9GAMM|nr:HAMP domain-containing sensor histidine kinase [Thiohalorhabdus denitrificans]SCY37800.1 Signal transduction histidine kinase [Thiohalorhabdus denitrificans]
MAPFQRLPLQTKGALYVLLLIVTIFLTVSLVVYTSVHRDLEQQLVDENLRMVRDLSSNARSPILTTDLTALQKLVEQAGSSRAVEAAVVTDATGRILASTDMSGLGQKSPEWATGRVQEPPSASGWNLLPLASDELLKTASHPIEVRDEELGKVHVRFDPSELRQIVAENLNATLRKLLWLGLFTGVVGTAGAFLISGFVTRPIRRLTGQVEAMERELTTSAPDQKGGPAEGDELVRLQYGFERLRSTLDRYLVELDRLHRKQQALNCLATIGEMSAHVAHELRNSLSSLRGAARYLRRHPEATQKTEFSEIIEEEVHRLYEMTEGFLDFSRPFEPQLEERDLCALIQDTCARLATDYENAGVTLEFTCSEGRTCLLDAQLIHQALVNLLTNALDVLEPGDRVHVSMEPGPDGTRRVIVRDTGPGIPAEDRERIFKPFVTTKTHGSGLGLAVVSKVVLQHGGNVEVDDAPGGGARFTLTIPKAG